MSETALADELPDLMELSNSSQSDLHSGWASRYRAATRKHAFDFETFRDNFNTHKSIISQSATIAAHPIIYIRVPRYELVATANSSTSITADAAEQYDRIERQLVDLSKADRDAAPLEDGAISSALIVVNELKRHLVAPPEISWHGGDAVVMLWALGDTTYAITVTDGELGYVVRKNRKALKVADSINVQAFRLPDLR